MKLLRGMLISVLFVIPCVFGQQVYDSRNSGVSYPSAVSDHFPGTCASSQTVYVTVLSTTFVCGVANDWHQYSLLETTVEKLPSATVFSSLLAKVTDGSSSSDCATGGGSSVVLCIASGGSWSAYGGGGSGPLPLLASGSKGTTASKPATCTTGQLYFATDATAGQNIYECSSTNVWTQQLNSGGSGSAFSAITSGTNSTMSAVCATGCSMTPSGTGTIGASTVEGGAANDVPYQTAGGVTGFIAPNNNSVLVTNGSGVPSESTSLPSGLTIPGYFNTAGTGLSSSGTTINCQTPSSSQQGCPQIDGVTITASGPTIATASSTINGTTVTPGSSATVVSSVFSGLGAVTVASSGTPTFNLAATSNKSPGRFQIAPTVNVTAPTITNATPGAEFIIAVTTDGTHTWSWNSIISDNTCSIYTAAAATTYARIQVDQNGSTLHGIGCGNTVAGMLAFGATVSPSTTAPGASNMDVRLTSNGIDALDNNGVHWDTAESFTAVAHQWVNAFANGVLATTQPASTDLSDNANVVHTNASYTWGAFLQDFSSATLKIPTAASFTSSATSMFGLDSTNDNIHGWNGASDLIVGLVSGTVTNGDCPELAKVSNKVTIIDSGSACGGSGSVSSFTGDGTLLNNSASTGAVTATLATAGAHKYFGNNTGSTAAPGYDSIVSGDLPVAQTRRTCVFDNDTQSATALTAANFSGRCVIPAAATIIEVDVSGGTGTLNGTAAALTFTGTSSIQIGKHGVTNNASLMSGLLATVSGVACALTTTSGTCIFDNGLTSSSSITISTTSLSAGDELFISAASADTTQTWFNVAVIYTIN